MDINRILHRAYDLTRSYRALWLFGFIFALTSVHGGGGNGGGGGGGSSSTGASAGLASGMPSASTMTQVLSDPSPAAIAAVVAVLIGIVFLLAGLVTAARVVSETAMIRMVDGAERTGQRSGVGTGFRLGWSRAAWRIFLIDLLLFAGGTLASLVLLGVALTPLLLWLTGKDALMMIGAGFSALLVIPVMIIIILGIIALLVLKEFFHRAAAIEGQGVLVALRRGWQVAIMRPSDTLLMGLVLFAISLAAALAMVPLFILLAGTGVLAGGVPGLLVALVTGLFTNGNIPWLVGMVIALPIFILVVTIPMVMASGLVQVFYSATWTLAYRELTLASQ